VKIAITVGKVEIDACANSRLIGTVGKQILGIPMAIRFVSRNVSDGVAHVQQLKLHCTFVENCHGVHLFIGSTAGVGKRIRIVYHLKLRKQLRFFPL
jgi:hypothetical protein